MYKESEHPRRADGEWTDAGTAIQRAASDLKKDDPVIELKTNIDRLKELRDKIQLLAHDIQFNKNNGAITGEVSELIDEWSSLKDKVERLEFLHNGVAIMQDQIKNDALVVGHIKERIQLRLDRDLETVDKEIKSAKRVEKKAREIFNSHNN